MWAQKTCLCYTENSGNAGLWFIPVNFKMASVYFTVDFTVKLNEMSL